MRKYLSKALGDTPLMHTRLKSNDLHWVFMAALVEGCACYLSTTDLEDLRSALKEHNASSLLSTIARIDNYLIEYDRETDVSKIRAHRQLVSFLKKFPFSEEEYPNDRREAGKQKMLAAERQCRDTNSRLRQISRSELPAWVPLAQTLIESVLGELTPRKVMNIISRGNHGPGATRSSRGNRTTPYYKYMDFPYSCTAAALPYATAAISQDPHWLNLCEASGRRKWIPLTGTPVYQRELQIVQACTEIEDNDSITFVPKDARTDRPIAISASLNMYLQLGVKDYMEQRLKVVGIDLTDQSYNQRLAYLGSRYAFLGSEENPKQFSTIDLASASDTVSYEIVKLLLPSEWFAFLCDLRHEQGELDGELITYEKFSAMGNGYTFPLETLIFWACTKASLKTSGYNASPNDISVYGDDIVCRREGVNEVISALEWAGFSVNTDKSFTTGLFKESCGKDYFNGHDVRAFYLKRRIKTYEDIYFICNQVASKIMLFGSQPGYSSLYNACAQSIPLKHRRFLPLESTEDCGFRVPLSIYRSCISMPYLYNDEIQKLKRKKRLGSFVYTKDPFVVYERYSARQHRGYVIARFYLSLRMSRPIHNHMERSDILNLEASTSGIITRRNDTKVNIRIETCSVWNGHYSRDQLSRFPSFNWDI